MPTSRLLGREVETRTVSEFLATDVGEPTALVVEGEPGIGKTTLWLDGVERARERGFTVLAARPAAAESALSYSSLADLLGGVDTAILSELPAPQRLALDLILLRADAGEAATDPRAVAAALLSIVRRLATESPVLVAIDDLQWLDASSAYAIAFAARRLAGSVAVLVTMRDDRDSVAATSWLQLPTPDAIRRISLRPMDVSGLHAVIADRLGRSFPRSTMLDVHGVSRGNPFYGLELARSLDGRALALTSMPGSLAEVVRSRIDGVDRDVRHVLLAIACLAVATVELVGRATDIDDADLVALLQDAESAGIIDIGVVTCASRIHFSVGGCTPTPLRRTVVRCTRSWQASSASPSHGLDISRWRQRGRLPPSSNPSTPQPNWPASEVLPRPRPSYSISALPWVVTPPCVRCVQQLTTSNRATRPTPGSSSTRPSLEWRRDGAARTRSCCSLSSHCSTTVFSKVRVCSNVGWPKSAPMPLCRPRC